ncbi:MAG: hypothetical protein LBI72_12130 [Flavobacteriaceae bacterium]|nr:hypothetical protein [Flavobacteriaceae bacterium]
MKIQKLFILLFCLGVIFQSCKKGRADEFNLSNPKLYSEYITSFSAGVISTKDPIDIGIQKNWGNWQPNQEIDKKYISTTPSIDGKLYYLPNNVLRFIPEKRLEQNQKINVVFRLGEVTKVEDQLEEFSFMVMTTPQVFAVELLDFQSADNNTYALNGNIVSSDWITVKQLNSLLEIKQNNKKLPFKIIGKDTDEAKDFSFIINQITRGTSISDLEFTLNGKPINVEQKLTLTEKVPVTDVNTAFKVRAIDDEGESFWINFSNPIKKNQDFSGLVQVEKHSGNLTFTTEGNLLKVFSDVPFQDEHTINVYAGIEDINGEKTPTTSTFTLKFGIQKPEVKIIKSGTILPSSENLKINFQATTLKAVDVKVYKIYENNILQFLQENSLNGKYSLAKVADPVATTTIQLTNPNPKALLKWNSYALDLASIIYPDPGAIYRVELSFKKSYSLYNCTANNDNNGEEEEETTDIVEEEDSTNEGEYNDYEDYYYYDYDWEQKDNPCDNSYYYYREKAATNVLATDLGVIGKRGNDNNYFFAVNDLLTTEPVQGATIEIYSFQQQLLATLTTDKEGIATHRLDKKQGVFAIVKKDKNTTYLKLDAANALSMSNYDVDGQTLQKGLKGFIYGERGVWRPGDNIYLGFILDDASNPIPVEHPITVTLKDPFGKIVEQEVEKKNVANHYRFILKTSEEAPTGNWEAMISVGGAKFYKQIKVETIKPNRLKVKNNIDGKLIAAGTQATTLNYNVQWLQGTIARNLKADVQLKLIPQATTFEGYAKYSFSNNLSTSSTEETNVYNGRTDENGNFSFRINTSSTPENSGMLKAILTTKVYENGGDFSTDVSVATYSPYSQYTGIKVSDANKYGYYETAKPIGINFVTLSERGNPVSGTIKVDIYKNNRGWWWDDNSYGISSYSASNYYTLYNSFNLTTKSNGTTNYTLNIPEEDWGRYEIVTTNLESGHISSSSIYVDWSYYSTRSKNTTGKEATILSIATDKTDYNINEKAKISFPSSEGGRALISVENGSSVVETHWVKTAKGETVFDLPITAAMAPNVYINITMIQPHATTINNSPIRLYGVVPINVYNKATKLEPTISMPDKLKPEQKFTVQVKEKAGQKMTYTLAIVEDGLLDLTRYKTPKPWTSFYSKNALGVRTWDIYDDVIGAYGGAINQVFSIGGDEDLGAGQVKKANRFKPVVIFQGPFTIEAGKTGTHEIALPKYIGSVRVMVVASNTAEKAYGTAEKTVKVNNPLMILGSLPRRAIPGEKVTLPVTVFTMEKHVKNVTLRVKTDDKFQLTSSATQSLTFTEPDEKIAYFELDVLQKTGISKIQIEATSGNEKATYEVELDVINPNPITVKSESVVLEPNSSKTVSWDRFGVTGTNTANIEVSTFPGINLTNRLNYLINYPHGCSEQVTSGAFPQLYLTDFMDLTEKQKKNIQNNVNAGIQKLADRQLSDGSFTYWSGSRYYDDWSTSYVGHFYLEAEKKGYVLPIGSKANWLSFQQKAARQWKFENRYGNDFAQAYRLYTLALAGSPDLASMNRLRETKGISNDSKLRLAAAYALAGQKDAAQKLSSNIVLDNVENYTYYGSYERNLAMALETLIVSNINPTRMHEYAIELANNLSSDRWMSTQTTAFGLNAIAQYAKKNKSSKTVNVSYSFNGATKTLTSKRNYAEAMLTPIASNNIVEFTNNTAGTVYTRVAYSGVLPIGEEYIEESKLSIRSVFHNNGTIINPSTITQGTEFICDITITNTSQKGVENIALSHIIPSGWEIVNLRYTDAGGVNNQVDHTDIRDDRTQFYFTLGGNSSKTLRVVLNASYLGRYYMPGMFANAMYDNSYRVRTAGQWIEVVR